MGEIVVHHTVDHVQGHFKSRSRYALTSAIILAALGGLQIVNTVRHIDADLAFFIIGVGCCVAAVQMVVGWGASDGHGKLAVFAADGHERLNEVIADRLEGMEEIERQTGRAVVVALDEVRNRRNRHTV